MPRSTSTLFPGDLVEVKSPDEILETLGPDGALAKLPFMPEMIEHCGKRFRVSRRVTKVCTSGAGSTMRAFQDDDVVFLENLRCSGAAHDGCEKACMIFWREAWLKKMDESGSVPKPKEKGSDELRARLRTTVGTSKYFCQASELLRAADPLSRGQRITTCFTDIRTGNCTVLQMADRIGTWLFWRARRVFLGAYARGNKTTTPMESLSLKAGDLVRIKPIDRIRESLNKSAHNRGLWFSPDMRLLCGQEKKVERRISKIIVDGTGEMRQLRNTVYLEGSMCGCAHVAFGGCSRCEFVYWREIWLQRSGTA